MKQRLTRSALCTAWMGGACAAMCTDGLACPSEPLMAAVCIMAMPWADVQGYAPANGAVMALQSNQALFSLIGVTYGGDGRTNFQLPDLRGRVVVGAGQGPGLPLYNAGDKAGTPTVMLTTANVPVAPHAHTLASTATAAVLLGTLTASTTLTGLSATTSMSGVTATASASGLNLRAYSGNGGVNSANGAALATSNTPSSRIYASNAPDVTMASGSISGSAPVSFTGNPTTTITGTPTTTLSGVPAVTVAGNTGVASVPASAAVSIMQPYLAMNYYIAVQGIYPQRN